MIAGRPPAPTRPRPHWIALVVLVATVVATVVPVGAQTLDEARREREENRRRQAEAAAELDVLAASNAELEAALNDLTAAARTAAARSSAAHQAADVAAAELATARQVLASKQAEISELRGEVVARAVAAYVHPGNDVLSEFGDIRDVNDFERRRVMLKQVSAHDADVMDQLKAAEEDLVVAQVEAEALSEKALARRAEADAAAIEAESARVTAARRQAEVDQRIAEFRAEVDALAKAESALVALIAKKEAEAYNGRVSATGLIWPVRGRVTSEYGPRWGRMHQGIDIGAPSGTPIWAAKAGTVIHAEWMGGYGNVVLIDHGEGFTTVYAHQSSIAVAEGQAVSRGEVIGYVGSTGRSTGPHLHFETRFGGKAQNPRNSLP
ncbi:MAG TPA: M23 family metallopeptidase [Acidimicrobiales bacterium]